MFLNTKQSLMMVFAVFTAMIFCCFVGCSSGKTPVPPKAKKIKKELVTHNHTRVDPYYWLNDRENPEVIDYLTAENVYTDAVMKHTEELQEKLFQEMTGRLKKDDATVPYKLNGYWYYRRYEKGGEYPIHCRKKGTLEANEEIMLNVNEMAKGHDYFSVRGLAVSPDNKLLSYGVDTVSRRLYTLHIKNLETGEILKDRIRNVSGASAWADDNRTLFYVLKDTQTLRAFKVCRHVMGAPADSDVPVFTETDDTFRTTVYRSRSQKYIFIGSFQTLSSEYRFLDVNDPAGEFSIIQPRQKDLEYELDHLGDYFYIRTNDQAKNFKLVRAPVKSPARENWEDVIPHRKDVLLSGFELFKNYLAVNERVEGLRKIRVISWKDKSEYFIPVEEVASVLYLGENPDPDTDTLRYEYSSFITPDSIYDIHMKTKEKKLMKKDEVLGGYNPALYQSERLMAKARDGVMVPISIVYKKGIKKDGSNLLHLYAYGSYGASMDPSFRSKRLSLLDRGFIWATAHIRGGQEMGRHWYEDGKLLKKKNTFTDFIDCAKHLIKLKYTSPKNLFAEGGSAGGLLMGAVVNMNPELFRGVLAGVPFVDVVTTMLDDTIPLTTFEYDEWGNPNVKEYYDYMLSYSPYDNVEARDYPNMLVTTGLHDSQVQYWEPAKWVAKLRDMKTDKNLLLLHTNMDAGHGGQSGRFKRYREVALEYAFLLDLAGISN
jgi:oligopeptidase B